MVSPAQEAIASLGAAHEALVAARQAERDAVVNARLRRVTWQEIADVLGMKRQSAQGRFAVYVEECIG